jgi:hypothetical protein
VSENGEAIPVRDEPWHDLGKQFAAKGELTAAARMRSHGLLMHAADRQGKRPAGGFTQLSRLLAAVLIEIDVSVVSCDGAHVVLRVLATLQRIQSLRTQSEPAAACLLQVGDDIG